MRGDLVMRSHFILYLIASSTHPPSWLFVLFKHCVKDELFARLTLLLLFQLDHFSVNQIQLELSVRIPDQ